MLVAQYYIWLYCDEDWSHSTSESRRQKSVDCTVRELSESEEEEDQERRDLQQKVLMSLKSGYEARADDGEELELLDDHLYQLATYYVQKESHA
jgi:hypothetical protein